MRNYLKEPIPKINRWLLLSYSEDEGIKYINNNFIIHNQRWNIFSVSAIFDHTFVFEIYINTLGKFEPKKLRYSKIISLIDPKCIQYQITKKYQEVSDLIYYDRSYSNASSRIFKKDVDYLNSQLKYCGCKYCSDKREYDRNNEIKAIKEGLFF